MELLLLAMGSVITAADTTNMFDFSGGIDVMKIGLLVFILALAACSPEVGSAKWCEKMKQKPEGDWSLNQATDYAKHCLFK